ncbi:hypothetical protein N7463_003498 [Penicillium fimorum]|uniref:Uncharacterized protein n=1 Tax=Penicillium fimorum TaxID=1882269 RepID=A0A9W9Y133_9EURO|nr:hypothetical protein N7463_003498 [Penicillium fimorum]
MCDMPFFPIFPICFQCNTDQNPCHCKVVGPTLDLLLPPIDLLWLRLYSSRKGVCPAVLLSCFLISRLTNSSMLGYPVKLNQKISNAIPF